MINSLLAQIAQLQSQVGGSSSGSSLSGGEADVRSIKLFSEEDAKAGARDQLVGSFFPSCSLPTFIPTEQNHISLSD